jgi:hypothetical protein
MDSHGGKMKMPPQVTSRRSPELCAGIHATSGELRNSLNFSMIRVPCSFAYADSTYTLGLEGDGLLVGAHEGNPRHEFLYIYGE